MLHNNYTNEEYKSYHVILPADSHSGYGELLLGDLNAATDAGLMEHHKVKTIITAATGLEHLKIPPEQTHIVFPLLDLKTENIQAYFQLSNQSIEQNLKRGSVLVHCGAGISRSATLVIAYYMKKYKTPFAPAIKHVRSCRPNICPNLGFQLQLKHYQEQLGVDTDKKQPKLDQSQHNKKQFIQTKQMLLTFNAPNQTKTSRMSNTQNKAFGNYTPTPARKQPNYSTSKRKMEGDLQIIGHHAEVKEWGWEDNKKGYRNRDSRSFKL